MNEEELETQIFIAEIFVSLATHIAMLDNEIGEEDEDNIADLVGTFFEGKDGLFPEGSLSEEQEDEIMDILDATIDDPIAMEDLIMYGRDEAELGQALIEFAEDFLQDKEAQTPEEIAFLENLKKELV